MDECIERHIFMLRPAPIEKRNVPFPFDSNLKYRFFLNSTVHFHLFLQNLFFKLIACAMKDTSLKQVLTLRLLMVAVLATLH